MDQRSSALAAMRGQPVEMIPFIGRMELWYNYHHAAGTLPSGYRSAGLWDVQRDLGIGILGFNAANSSFIRLEPRGVDVSQHTDGETTTTRWSTPHGDLTARDVRARELNEAALSAARVEFPCKSVRDYDALMHIITHTEPVEEFDEYARYIDAIGSDGVALPLTGHLPAHQLMLHFMGYETFYCELNDHPEQVEALVQALTDQYERLLRLAAGGPAEALEVGANYDEFMTPPPVFRRFFAPFYRWARELLERSGKVLVVHGDGEMRELLRELRDCGVQVVEALTPRPMTSIDIRETRQIWEGRVAMWGGIPSVVLTDSFSDEQFEQCMADLFDAVAPGERFILGFGDNVPTDALFSRIRRCAEIWRENAYRSPAD